MSWMLQAGLRSTLSLVGAADLVSWTYYWVKIERLTWVLYGWVILMLLALLLTDSTIFLSWGKVLMTLSPLWLGMSGIGYFWTGWAVRSRAFSCNFFSFIWHFAFPLNWRLVCPIYGSCKGI
ncbi:hypothetical protein QUA13_13220 [Microcoleus sp. S28C3]|uniref:hypothetical protein n=1 Tax=Microcoleus sp. S28C3 TaxID=3055414 RepID=UPI002FD4A67A